MTASANSALARVVTQLRNKLDWKQLLDGHVDAIHLRAFAPPTECAELVTFIVQHPRTVPYGIAKGILRLGSSFKDIRNKGNVADEYSKPDILEEALRINGVVCRILGTITASWPFGLETFPHHGIALHRSIGRRIIGGSAVPHDDDVAKELPDDPIASAVRAQLGLNLYLEMPEEGGELEGWHRRMSRDEYERVRNPDPMLAYGIRPDAVGNGDWLIKPGLGDLIIFANCQLHAIRKTNGARTTWGFFIGYRDDNKPLLIWS